MSRNALVQIDVINTALSLTTRPFDSVLLLSKTKDINNGADNLPIYITSANDLLSKGVLATDDEYLYARDFFGASPKPDKLMVYGVASGTYADMLAYLELQVPKTWFYTLIADGTATGLADAKAGIAALKNRYVWLTQSPAGATASDIVTNVEGIKDKYGFFVAANVAEKQVANLVATRSRFFPGSVVFSSTLLSGMLGSTYDDTEKNMLVGPSNLSETGINICTVEDQMPVIYYGKAMDGITWFDYVLAEIAIDEYMRVGLTKFFVTENTKGNKFSANDIGAARIVERGKSILRDFANRNIIYPEDAKGVDGERLFSVEVASIVNREVEIVYQVYFQGAIIKGKVEIKMDSIGGN